MVSPMVRTFGLRDGQSEGVRLPHALSICLQAAYPAAGWHILDCTSSYVRYIFPSATSCPSTRSTKQKKSGRAHFSFQSVFLGSDPQYITSRERVAKSRPVAPSLSSGPLLKLTRLFAAGYNRGSIGGGVPR